MGDANGGYPSGNSIVVRGSSEAVIIDPSVTVVEKGGAPVHIDAMITSHGHEDHLPGTGLFTDARVHVHEADKHVLHDLSHMLDAYQLTGPDREELRESIITEFNFAPRPDAEGFHDGHVWNLGEVDVEAVHLPGHTAGHSGFRISEGVFFLSDIDLTGFGPYYGDTWSSLDDFENSSSKCVRRKPIFISPSTKKVSSKVANGLSKCSMRTTASFIGGITTCSSFLPSPDRSTKW